MPNKFFVFLYITTIVVILCGAFGLRNKKDKLSRHLFLTDIFGAIIAIAYTVSLISNDFFVMSMAYSIMFAAVDWTLYYLMLFTCEYTKETLGTKKLQYALCVVMVVDSVSLFLNPFFYHVLEYDVYEHLNGTYLSINSKALYNVHLAICYLMVVLIAYMYVYKMFQTSRFYRKRYEMILGLFAVLILINVLFVFTEHYIDWSILMYGILAVVIYFLVYHFEPKDFLRRAKAECVENIDAALFIFDNEDKMIANNKSARSFITEKHAVLTYDTLYEFAEKWGMNKILEGSDNSFFEWRYAEADTDKYYNVSFRRIKDKKGKYIGSYIMLEDTTEKRNLECYDRLTRIYNRDFFCHETRRLLQKCGTEGFIIVAFDIKCFKAINENMGTEAGDYVLRCVADVLCENRIPDSTFGRISGDHFIMCIREGAFAPAKLEEQVGEKYAELGFNIENGLSFGVYPINGKTIDVEQMCDRAMLALSYAKKSYVNNIAWYDSSMSSTMLEEQFVISELTRALAEKQFEVFLQPQYHAKTKTLAGSEALVRWKHPSKGYLPPNSFIPVFEKNGMITKLDQYVWERVCEYLAKWILDGRDMSKLSISVNISRVDLFYLNIVDVFENLIAKYKIDRKYIRLEITESAYISDDERILSTIEELQKHGFIVEMDDFGSGYSSLNCLKNAPVDVLKLDMRFLMGDVKLHRGEKILYSVVSMARDIGLKVIAEGVETAEQAELMNRIGVEILQGYYFAKPMSVEDFEDKFF